MFISVGAALISFPISIGAASTNAAPQVRPLLFVVLPLVHNKNKNVMCSVRGPPRRSATRQLTQTVRRLRYPNIPPRKPFSKLPCLKAPCRCCRVKENPEHNKVSAVVKTSPASHSPPCKLGFKLIRGSVFFCFFLCVKWIVASTVMLYSMYTLKGSVGDNATFLQRIADLPLRKERMLCGRVRPRKGKENPNK